MIFISSIYICFINITYKKGHFIYFKIYATVVLKKYLIIYNILFLNMTKKRNQSINDYEQKIYLNF